LFLLSEAGDIFPSLKVPSASSPVFFTITLCITPTFFALPFFSRICLPNVHRIEFFSPSPSPPRVVIYVLSLVESLFSVYLGHPIVSPYPPSVSMVRIFVTSNPCCFPPCPFLHSNNCKETPLPSPSVLNYDFCFPFSRFLLIIDLAPHEVRSLPAFFTSLPPPPLLH